MTAELGELVFLTADDLQLAPHWEQNEFTYI